jgi:hypothetical protein
MKPLERKRAQFAAIAGLALAVALTLPSHAQTVPQALSDAATAACKDSAVAKGFQVVNVVAVEPKSGTADAANVVLNLSKNGQAFKLTCGYTKAAGAAIGDTSSPAAVATATPSPVETATPSPTATPSVTPTPAPATAEKPAGISPWWWLLPILGIPLLALLFRSPRREAVAPPPERTYTPPPAPEPVRPTPDPRSYVTPAQAVVRGGGRSVSVYAGPATTHRVAGSLEDGQRIMLTGRTENGWAELTDGNWVPASSLEAV